MRQSFIFLSQYKSTSMEEKIKRKQVSSSTLIFIHHKDDTRRVFWYILCIILWCRDHFSNWKEVHIVIYSHLDITFGSDWKSPKLLYARRNDSNPYVKEWCFTLVLFLFQKALQYREFFPIKGEINLPLNVPPWQHCTFANTKIMWACLQLTGGLSRQTEISL